jgi:phage terminase large subunit-like protein
LATYGAAPDGVTLADIPLRVRSATNPGGPGHSWVYQRFVDKSNPERRPFLPSLLSDNPGIDADEYRAALAELPEVERRRMEEGDWDVVEIPGALWKFADLVHDIREKPVLGTDVDVRAVAVDPSVSKEGDECGIVIGSITEGVVTAEVDLSGNYHPDDWAKQAVLAYHEYGATRLLCEDNQGGALVFSAVGNAADMLGVPRPHVIRVRAKESKEARAIPVAVSYRAGKVKHLAGLRSGKLEAQMTSWIPGTTSKSPDRVDALVWLVRHLLFREGDAVEYHTSSARDKLSMASDNGVALRHRSKALRSGLVQPGRRTRRL